MDWTQRDYAGRMTCPDIGRRGRNLASCLPQEVGFLVSESNTLDFCHPAPFLFSQTYSNTNKQSKMHLRAPHTFLHLLSLLALAGPAFSQDHGEEAATEMGPVAFMWPPDREWGAAQDNRAPCGSSQGVVNRTDFPLGVLRPFD